MRKSTKSARSNSIKRVQIAISGENHVRMLRSRINFIANLPSLSHTPAVIWFANTGSSSGDDNRVPTYPI